MPIRNPFIVGYADLIGEQLRHVENLKKIRENKLAQGDKDLDAINRRINIQNRILKLLEMYRKDQQIDLFQTNAELNRR